MCPSSHSSGSRTSTKSGRVRALVALVRVEGRDLVDLVLHPCEQLSVPGHYFPNYSGGLLGGKPGLQRAAHGYRRRVTARTRILGLVALASAAAVAVVAVAVVSAGDGSNEPPWTRSRAPGGRRSRSRSASGPTPRPATSHVARTLYARGDYERRGEALREARLARGEGRARAHVLARPGYDRLEQLAKLYPENGLVQLHLGLARLWAGRGDPVAAWQAVEDAEPDSPYAVLAGNLLFPRLPRGLPTFVPSFAAPADDREAPAGEAARSAARAGGAGRRPGAPALRRRPPARRAPRLCARGVRACRADGPARRGGERRRGRRDASTRLAPQTPSVASAR